MGVPRIRRSLTCFCSDARERETLEPLAAEAETRGYDVNISNDLDRGAEIGVYCQPVCRPELAKLSVAMLHDLGESHEMWPDLLPVWLRQHWDEFDLGLLPGPYWAERWGENAWHPCTQPRSGAFALGWPKADEVFRHRQTFQRKAGQLRKALGLKYRQTVLYAPSWENDGKQDRFVQRLRHLPVNLLLKQCPSVQTDPRMRAEIERANAIHRDFDNVYIVHPDTYIMYCLALADVVVSEESGVMIEASLFDVPSVAVMDWGVPVTGRSSDEWSPSRPPVVPFDFIEKVSEEALTSTVQRMLAETDRYRRTARDARQQMFANLGQSAQKIMTLVDALAAGESAPFEPIPRPSAAIPAFFQELQNPKSGRPAVAIWGASTSGRQALHFLARIGLEVDIVVDGDPGKWGSRFDNGCRIERPDVLASRRRAGERIRTIITSNFPHEIAASLRSMGFEGGVDFWPSVPQGGMMDEQVARTAVRRP